MFIVTYIETGDTCDGRIRKLDELCSTRKEAFNLMKEDMQTYQKSMTFIDEDNTIVVPELDETNHSVTLVNGDTCKWEVIEI